MAGRFPARNIGRAAPELHASLACSRASSDVQWVQGSRTNTTSAYEVFKRSIASPGPRTSTLTPPIAPGHAAPGSVDVAGDAKQIYHVDIENIGLSRLELLCLGTSWDESGCGTNCTPWHAYTRAYTLVALRGRWGGGLAPDHALGWQQALALQGRMRARWATLASSRLCGKASGVCA